MALSRSKNRRRVDVSERKATASNVLGAVARAGLWVCASAAVIGGIVLGGQAAYGWALTTPRLALTSVSLQGNKRSTEAELVKLGGLTPGQNLIELDPGVVERALAQHPWVRQVEVRRHFPHGVFVRVWEHEPAAMVSLGELYVVDLEGEPFKKLQAQDGVDVPLITGVDREAFMSRRDETRAAMRSALEMASAYEESALSHGAPLSEVRLAAGGVTLVTGPQGQEVRMGAGATAEKLARLAKVRGELARRGVKAQVIHLDNRRRPGWVAVKLAIAGSERTGGSP
jgi:cell division protein FtsQ